jgi:hypothetical protein
MFQILSNIPIRLKEFTSMMFEDNGQYNYINLENKHILIRKHKNDKHSPERIIELNEDDIKHLIYHKNITNSNYLFSCKLSKKPMNEKDIEQFFRKTVEAFCKNKNIEIKARFSQKTNNFKRNDHERYINLLHLENHSE